MNIGIIGTGTVGKALAEGFAARGHAVRMGSRDPARSEHEDWLASVEGDVAVVPNREAATFGHYLVLATPWEATETVLEETGRDAFESKVVIDVTNPLDFSDGAPRLATLDPSGALVQSWLPEAYIVKAFNTVGAGLMVDPDLPGGPPTMFIAGDDANAKTTVATIAEEFGWETVDLGGIDTSHYLDGMAMVWIGHAMRTGGRNHAFKLLQG